MITILSKAHQRKPLGFRPAGNSYPGHRTAKLNAGFGALEDVRGGAGQDYLVCAPRDKHHAVSQPNRDVSLARHS